MFSNVFCIILVFYQLYGTLCLQDKYVLVINPNRETNANLIEESVNATLELTCQLIGFDNEYNVTLNWQLPTYNEKRLDAILTDDNNGSLKLTLNMLNEKDSGEYFCTAIIDQQILKTSIVVHVKRKKCLNKFECSNSDTCIHHRYVCDGRMDCKNGLDESPRHCGKDVCKGKIMCEDGRCIPASWCCRPLVEPNCTARVRHHCCPLLQDDDFLLHQNIMNNQHYNEMSFLQSTIYTIVGFAMVFMSIVTILMIAICRIHLQRSIVSSIPRRHPTNSNSLSRTPHISSSFRSELGRENHGNSRLFVSYNIPSNGMEIVGEVCQPPPYCEVTFSDPPPSYKDIFSNRTDGESETSPCLSSSEKPS